MRSEEIKKKVRKFKREYSLTDISEKTLRDVFEQQGFTIIEFNPVVNSKEVDLVVKSLRLSELISHSNGFLYVDQSYRLIFICEKLSDEEKTLVFAHEEGHYYCGHMAKPGIVGQSVMDEFEANEFAHYLLKESFQDRIKRYARRYRKWIITGIAAALLTVLCSFAIKEYHDRRLYEGEYYVTENGKKYHSADCITIQGSEVRRLTKEDVKSGQYTACEVCQAG